MNQNERIDYLINYLKEEANDNYFNNFQIDNMEDKRILLRSLMNIREPKEITDEFIKIQDEYLKERIKENGITDINDLIPMQDDLYLWKGDITTLRCDGIVNAANSGLLGCFIPCHKCIDNCIHTYAGVQLRNECAKLIYQQGHYEETGKAKITSAYNLPSKYILHTVGPIVGGELTDNDRNLLRSCYESCLTLADEYSLDSIAFCCISTGVFHFPNDEAAVIAINTVKEYKENTKSNIKVIFNVFSDIDYEIYERLLNI